LETFVIFSNLLNIFIQSKSQKPLIFALNGPVEIISIEAVFAAASFHPLLLSLSLSVSLSLSLSHTLLLPYYLK
jgi:hypothetical protein